MLLTRASEYALLALEIIRQNQKPVGADSLASRLGISKSFLAKILQSLAKQDILTSHKGANGGFALTKDYDKITVLEVVRAAEGKKPAVFECSPAQEACPSNRAEFCHLWPFLNQLQVKIDDFLATLTLKDIFTR